MIITVVNFLDLNKKHIEKGPIGPINVNLLTNRSIINRKSHLAEFADSFLVFI